MLHFLERLGILLWFTNNICFSSLTIPKMTSWSKGSKHNFLKCWWFSMEQLQVCAESQSQLCWMNEYCIPPWLNTSALPISLCLCRVLMQCWSMWWMHFRVLSLLKDIMKYSARTKNQHVCRFFLLPAVLNIIWRLVLSFCWSLVTVFSVFIYSSPVCSSQCIHSVPHAHFALCGQSIHRPG